MAKVEIKQPIVDEIKANIEGAASIVLVDHRGLTVEQDTRLRKALREAGIEHKLIPPRTPWHNGKVERSHRNDQRYFYDWEHFGSLREFNQKLRTHLIWSNNKTMRTLGRKSPLQLLKEKLSA